MTPIGFSEKSEVLKTQRRASPLDLSGERVGSLLPRLGEQKRK
jgi:hypothetical protein